MASRDSERHSKESEDRPGPGWGAECSTLAGSWNGIGDRGGSYPRRRFNGVYIMKNGQLSNKPVPHILLVFEGTLGFLDKDDISSFKRHLHKERFTDAAYLWQFHSLACRAVCDLAFRQDVLVEVITFICDEDEYLDALEYRITEEEDLPVRKVWATTPDKLWRMLSYMPEVSAVYTTAPEQASMFAPKGVLVRSVADIGRS